MQRAKIIETNLDFSSLNERKLTDMIVIHHTGERDIDASAKQIHGWHLDQGWSGIGYHFVVRKNGNIERGRPLWAIGSHAYGENSHTIGIHLSGDFEQAKPTTQQIEMTAMLIADLCADYNIPIDRKHIIGHGELMSTDCPGKNLQKLLDNGTITGKANWYRYQPPPDTVIKSVIAIRSGKPISNSTVDKIKQIFAESHCPNESLLHSIDDFSSFDGHHIIQLAEGDQFTETIEL